MSRKIYLALAAVGVLGLSAMVIGKTMALTVRTAVVVNPYTPRAVLPVPAIVPPVVTPAIARPPVRDPFRPPTRSAFVP